MMGIKLTEQRGYCLPYPQRLGALAISVVFWNKRCFPCSNTWLAPKFNDCPTTSFSRTTKYPL